MQNYVYLLAATLDVPYFPYKRTAHTYVKCHASSGLLASCVLGRLQLSASFPSRGLAMRRASAWGKTLCQQIVQRGGGARRPQGRFRSAGLRQDPHSLGILAGRSGTIKWSNLSWFRSAWEYSNIYFFPRRRKQFAALTIAADPCSCKPQKVCVGSQLAKAGPFGLVSACVFDFSDPVTFTVVISLLIFNTTPEDNPK